MAIDIETEDALSLPEAALWLYERGRKTRGGKPVSVRAILDWIAKGELEASPRRRGRMTYTTKQALARMMAGDSPKDEAKKYGKAPRKQRTRRDRERGHAEAMEYFGIQG